MLTPPGISPWGEQSCRRGPTQWGGADAPYERFAAGTTSAQAEFISAEHKKDGGPRKAELSEEDNAAMIGCQGFYEFQAGHTAGLELNAYATRDIALG